ncbi:MAG: 4Fe-4S cluster-binding domain-containing protein [Candidatus Methanomethylicus sp.]|nr:4Fe-4S cluster-binding domain-containing protein [Candidatus Methanomethylicus sp.]
MSQYSFISPKGNLEKVRKMARLKPRLHYLEVHVADHCNLNCKGCGHFSPIADVSFADLLSYQHDLKQLQSFFSTIGKVRLMGGEPLLHPEIESFVSATRATFPRTDIRICTNGILLPLMQEKFWITCKACSVGIDITVYPPLKKEKHSLVQLVKNKGLRVNPRTMESFHAFYNSKGDTDMADAFKKCRKREYMPMLREGKIYVCPKSAMIFYFNSKFGLSIPSSGFVDIFEPGLNGWDILGRLDEASETCRFCTLGWDVIPTFPWSISNNAAEDWDALKYRSL